MNRQFSMTIDISVFDTPTPVGDKELEQAMVERVQAAFVPHPDDTRRTHMRAGDYENERFAALVVSVEVTR